MEEQKYRAYLQILKEELVPALGCTEPIAIAYCAALAREACGSMPEHLDIYCSGNIIKNVKSVTVPNSGGLHGIEAAAVLGAVGGRADKKLEVLEEITPEQREQAQQLLQRHICTCYLEEGVENLYIRIEAKGQKHRATVVISQKHTHIERIERDGEILFQARPQEECKEQAAGEPHQGQELERQGEAEAKETEDKRSLLNVADILHFADTVRMEDIEEVIGRQIRLNTAISEEGLKNHYGAEVGRTLLAAYGDDVKVRAKAKAAAGSDARMNGCSLPVVINSGSGNQGMTCSLPVIEFAKEWQVSKEKLYRALVVSNLVAIHQKKYIGSLSAYCGAVSAACGAGAAIAYLRGGGYEAVSKTITNTIANMGGVVCDGAKSSCAAKIASSVDAAILAVALESANHCFQPGEGLVQDNVEDTIKNLGYVGRVGMKSTDVTILKLMIRQDEK